MPRQEQDPSATNIDIPRLQIMEDEELKDKILRLTKTLESGTKSRERSIALTKLEEASQWLEADIIKTSLAHPNAPAR